MSFILLTFVLSLEINDGGEQTQGESGVAHPYISENQKVKLPSINLPFFSGFHHSVSMTM
jgi:hypothetical protein